jgi:hypothetical protein
MLVIPKIKFIIFGERRSGTTLLKQLLDSHPQIVCDGELLNINDGYVKNRLLMKVVWHLPIQYFTYRATLSNRPCYGFTMLFDQHNKMLSLLNILSSKGWKIIHIYRENTVQQALSYLVAYKTNHWHLWPGKKTEIPKVAISTRELKERINLFDGNKAIEKQWLIHFNHFEVNYEKNLAEKSQWQQTADNIFAFLGIEPAHVSATLNKTYPLPYSEMIENYDELLQSVQSQIRE